MPYFVYMLRCSDNSLYTGITTDLIRRIDEHNTSPKGAKYTKNRRPVDLVHFEQCADKSSASKREHAIKRLTKAEKEMMIEKDH